MHIKTVIAFSIVLSALMSEFGCASSPFSNAPAKTTEDTAPRSLVAVSDPSANSAEPAVAVGTEGNVYVVYMQHAEDKSADLYVHRYDSSLRSLGAAVRINPIRGSVKAWYGDPPTIVISPDTTIYVGWTLRNGSGNDYVVSASRDGGHTFAPPTKINDDGAPVSHGMHSIAVDAAGSIYAAWLDERNAHKVEEYARMDYSGLGEFRFVKIDHKGTGSGRAPEPNSEVFFAVSTDGGTTFSKNQRIASEVCPCCKTAVVAGDGGRVYVSWRQVLDGDHRHIAVASSADGGKTFSPRSIVSDDKWQIAACPVSGAAMMVNGGDVDIAWFTRGDAGQPGYYFAKSSNGGATFDERKFVAGSASSGTPVLVRFTEGLKLVYAGEDGQTVIASSSDLGASFAVNQTLEKAFNPAARSGNGGLYIAFVRTDGKSQSVWLAKR